MLQRISEVLENENLLTIAAQEKDSLKRLAYVATFSATQYNSLQGRSLKPFNPLLGETFEYVTDKFRYISEQVCHHPPISACHAESDNYELFFHTNVKNTFWGKSIEMKPLGSMHVILKKYNEHYIINRPTTSAQNIIFGTFYVDCSGESVTLNHKTSEKCVFNYRAKGWSDDTYGLLDGFIYNSTGEAIYEIKGKWCESIWMTNLKTGEKETVWKKIPLPSDSQNLYGYTTFTLQLNYLPEKLRPILPHTDSRFRPDQKALENGDFRVASDEKNRLEEKQRAVRKYRDENKLDYFPAYFVEHDDELTNEKTYISTGKYWKDREKGQWGHLPDIFS